MITDASQKSRDGARVYVAGARAAYFGNSLDLAPHRNIAATVALGFEQPFLIRFLGDDPSRGGEAWRSERIALIPPGTLHHLRAQGFMGFLYLDPLSDDHRRLASGALSGAQHRIRAVLGRTVEPSLSAVCSALGIPARRIDDVRVARAVRAIDEKPAEFRTIDDAAACAGLSASRFRALFNLHVGLPFRRYRLWRRMARVMRGLSVQKSLTEVAHEAGFSSSAHLSTAFRDLFGLSPTDLLEAGITIDFSEDG